MCAYDANKSSFLDVTIAVLAVSFFLLPMIAVAIIIRLSSKGPALFWSERMGQNLKPFKMPKFRTMYVNTPLVATADLKHPEGNITPVGKFLRLTSFDELPQLYCILAGKMSCVGPRPVLCSETQLIKYRENMGIYKFKPGLTGWAQINGRDKLDIQAKADLDLEYIENISVGFYLKIIWLTLFQVLCQRDVDH